MVFGFSIKRNQKRNPDGTYTGPHGDRTVAARGVRADIAAVNKTLEDTLNLAETIENAGLRRMERQARHSDMLEDLEGVVEGDGEVSFESMVMKLLPTLINQGGSQSQAGNTGESWEQGGFLPHNASLPQAQETPPPVQQEPAQGVDRLNQVLHGIKAIPDKVVSEAAINKICEMEGIDKEALKVVVKKLAPVMIK